MNADGSQAMIRCGQAETLGSEAVDDPLFSFAREKALGLETAKEYRASSPIGNEMPINSVLLFDRDQKTWEKRTATDDRSIRARWDDRVGAGRTVDDIPKEIWKSKKSTRQRIFKVIMLGDTNVGKTCLAVRFCGGSFPEKVEATIGVDFRERNVDIGEETIKLQIWDTAGQERFHHSMVPHYYRNANAIVFVYDMTKISSFESLPGWICECNEYNFRRDIPRILVGNKCDLHDAVTVPTNTAQQFADHHQMPLFETSAKDNSESNHVDSIFLTLAYKLKCGCSRPWMQVPKNLGGSWRASILLSVLNSDQQKKDESFCMC